MSDETKVADAITALASRLEQWGVDDAPAKAETYVRDMIRQGWRPRALAAVIPIDNPRPLPQEAVKRFADTCRSQLHGPNCLVDHATEGDHKEEA